MVLGRLRAWLPSFRWRRGAPRDQQSHPKPEWEEGGDGMLAGDHTRPRWAGTQRLLALVGWGAPRGEGEGLATPRRPPAPPEHFQICFNFTRHLFDLGVVTLLCASAPAFRLALDVLGLRGVLGVWLHGLACFLVTASGLYAALWLVHEYLLPFACLYGLLQTFVLSVSLRAAPGEGERDEGAVGAEGESGGEGAGETID